MAFNLINELNDAIRGNPEKFGKEGTRFMQPTGFDCFDYLNAEVALDANGKKTINTGIDHGKIVTVIGKSGSGKTTWALQAASQMMQQYEQSSLFVFDFEQGSSKERIKQITGMSEDYYNSHVTLLQNNISTQSVLRLVMQIKKLKDEHRKELLVDNVEGKRDENGDIIKIMPPTFIVIDSIATMMPEDQADMEEMAGQMTATGIAKMNTQLFKRITIPCAAANIIPIFINHINQKIETTIVPTQAQVNYLSQNETLPGGNACIYLTNTLVRITTASKLEPEKGYQIKGFEAKVALVKSRSSAAGRAVTMIFNQTEGFDNDLSKLEFIKACGKLKGAGVSYKLDGLEDHPFRLSAFKDKLATDPVLRAHFDKLSTELLAASVRESGKLREETAEADEILSAEEIAAVNAEADAVISDLLGGE